MWLLKTINTSMTVSPAAWALTSGTAAAAAASAASGVATGSDSSLSTPGSSLVRAPTRSPVECAATVPLSVLTSADTLSPTTVTTTLEVDWPGVRPNQVASRDPRRTTLSRLAVTVPSVVSTSIWSGSPSITDGSSVTASEPGSTVV